MARFSGIPIPVPIPIPPPVRIVPPPLPSDKSVIPHVPAIPPEIAPWPAADPGTTPVPRRQGRPAPTHAWGVARPMTASKTSRYRKTPGRLADKLPTLSGGASRLSGVPRVPTGVLFPTIPRIPTIPHTFIIPSPRITGPVPHPGGARRGVRAKVPVGRFAVLPLPAGRHPKRRFRQLAILKMVVIVIVIVHLTQVHRAQCVMTSFSAT